MRFFVFHPGFTAARQSAEAAMGKKGMAVASGGLWRRWRGDVWRRLRGDVLAGFTVALVALPLALAFGIASGAGPAAGLYSAIFAGFFTSLFGGSQLNVSGPTGAMTVVLVDIIN